MADDKFLIEAAGTTMAAFILAQLAFWNQVRSGVVSQDEAIRQLEEAVAANAKGGPANQKAAQALRTVLDLVRETEGPTSH